MSDPKIKIGLEDDRITIEAPYQYKDLCRSLPGSTWNGYHKEWSCTASQTVAYDILTSFGAANIDAPPTFWEMAKEGEPSDQAMAVPDQLTPIPLTKTEPWSHQLQAYHLIANSEAFFLAWEMGTGKTKPVVDAICNLGSSPNLIVCPKSVVAVWKHEFEKHAAYPVSVVALDTGSVAERTERANDAIMFDSLAVVVINYEAARASVFAGWAMSIKWAMVVADESHKIKSAGSVVSRFMGRLGKQAFRRICLTGTPMAQSPLDVYGQFRFLDPNIFGTSWAQFRDEYAVMGGYQVNGRPVQIVGYRNQAELHRKFYILAHRVTADEVLDLPDVVHEERIVELSPTARKIYCDLAVEFIAWVNDEAVTASTALVKLLRLQQVTSGFAVDEQGELIGVVDRAKETALQDTIEAIDPGEHVVVFCKFRHDLAVVHEVAERLGRPSYELSGCRNELSVWQQGESRGAVLAVQIQAGGVGIDLTRARYCIYFSLGFSLCDYEQSLARIHRPGQTQRAIYVHIIAKDTVDEQVYGALRSRKEVVAHILDGMKATCTTE